jgi:hypothetical protein
MLRCYDQSDSLSPELLGRIFGKLLAIKNEFNVLDLSSFINIYLKHSFAHPAFDPMVSELYSTLRRNVDDISF